MFTRDMAKVALIRLGQSSSLKLAFGVKFGLVKILILY